MSPTEIGAAVAAAAVAIGAALRALKSGTKADHDANENAAIAQIYTGYSNLLERIQKDNRELRAENAELRRVNADLVRRVTALEKRLERLT